MALSPDKRAYFESQGTEAIRIEVGERKHGQAPDSPYWQEAMAWVEAAEAARTFDLNKQSTAAAAHANELAKEANTLAQRAIKNSSEANEIARSALEASRRSVRLAALAILVTIALAVRELVDWYAK